MYKDNWQYILITCDKCWKTDIEVNSEEWKNRLFKNWWTLNSSAKKYIHTCLGCKTKKEKKAHEFIKRKFW